MRISSTWPKIASLSAFILMCSVTQAATTQPTHFRITNHCTETIWIQQDWKRHTSDKIVEKITPGSFHDYQIPDTGLPSTRFWPKKGCNESGYDCRLGESVGVPEAEAAGIQRGPYAPDINSKFEATWGCVPAIHNFNPSACALNPSAPANDPDQRLSAETWWNGSAVDGYTLPYRINVYNHNGSCEDPMRPGQALKSPSVDCAGLDVQLCPTNENLSPSPDRTTINGVDVSSVNLQWLDQNNTPIGCFSPCSKLTMAQGSDDGSTKGGWKTILGGLVPTSPEAQMYCCPTPPVSPEQCSAGPAATSAYSKSVHLLQKCTAYTYAYDDAKGLAKCSADTKFEVIFCPTPADATGGDTFDGGTSQNTNTDTNTATPQASMKLTIPETVKLLLDNQLISNNQTVTIKNNQVFSLEGQPTNTCLLSVNSSNQVAIQNGSLCSSISIDNTAKTITISSQSVPSTPSSSGYPIQVNFNPAFNIKAYIDNKPTNNAQVWQSSDLSAQSLLKANQQDKWGECQLTISSTGVKAGTGELCHRLNIVKEATGKVHVYLPADIPNNSTPTSSSGTGSGSDTGSSSGDSGTSGSTTSTPKYVVFGMDANTWVDFKDQVVSNGTKVALDIFDPQTPLTAHQNQLSASCIIGKSGDSLSIVQDSGLLCQGGLVLVTQQNGDYYVGIPSQLPVPTSSNGKSFSLGIAQGMSITVGGKTVSWNSPDKNISLPPGQSNFAILGNNRITKNCMITLTDGNLTWPKVAECDGVVVHGNIIYFPAF